MSGFYNSLLNGSASNEEIIDEIARVGKQLDFLLSGNLGSKNIREVGDYLVGANDFVSRSGTVGISSLVTGADDLRFWAGSVARETAPFRVYESGDTHVANLLATGGTVTGATIQTSVPGSYPRVELNSTGPYLVAQASATDELSIDTTLLGSPAIVFDNGSIVAAMYLFSLFTDKFIIQSQGEIVLDPGAGYDVVFGNWDEIYSDGAGQNLQTALNAKANSFTGLTSAVGVIDSDGVTPKTLNFTNGVLTSVT